MAAQRPLQAQSARTQETKQRPLHHKPAMLAQEATTLGYVTLPDKAAWHAHPAAGLLPIGSAPLQGHSLGNQ
jgi:hypothetical protein